MKHKTALLIGALCFLVIICAEIVCHVQNHSAITNGYAKAESNLQKRANTERICIVSTTQGARTHHFSVCDVSDTYVYFGYNHGSIIDTYDHNGMFQFSIIVPDANNGRINIRCEGNRLYVSTKDKALYIFEGQHLVNQLSYDQATQLGYDYTWFHEVAIKLDRSQIYFADNLSDTVMQIQTPQVIRNNWPNPLMPIAVLTLACTAMFILGKN